MAQHKTNTALSISFTLLLIILTTILSGCGNTSHQVRYIWPIPPLVAKIEFLQNIYHPDDFRTKSSSFKKNLLGKQEPLFKLPFDLLANQDGRLIVSDSQAGLLWVLNSNGQVSSFPNDGHRLKLPLGLAEDETDHIYVAEGKTKRIAVLDSTGQIERYIGENFFTDNPTYLAIDIPRKILYASNTRQHKVEAFSLAGEHLFTIGYPGIEPGQLAAPQGLAVNKKGELIVAEMLNSRLSIFDSKGRFLRTIPFSGWGPYVYGTPKGVTLSPDGRIWVTDQRIGALVVFNREEKPEMVIGAGRMSAHPMAFAAPSGLRITSKGSLWVADALLRRLSHWQQLTPAYMTSHPLGKETLQRLSALGTEFDPGTSE